MITKSCSGLILEKKDSCSIIKSGGDESSVKGHNHKFSPQTFSKFRVFQMLHTPKWPLVWKVLTENKVLYFSKQRHCLREMHITRDQYKPCCFGYEKNECHLSLSNGPPDIYLCLAMVSWKFGHCSLLHNYLDLWCSYYQLSFIFVLKEYKCSIW